MKLNSLIKHNQDIKRRCFAVLMAFLLLGEFGSVSLAQLKSHRRITSLQFGNASEGSRVSLFSDSALNDYEAFRRGDRFYVKVPLADFSGTQPDFRGGGFEDVEVQKVGDSVLVSFKLQPGATARVDQHSNRLDVIFSAPNKSVRSATVNSVTSTSIPGIVMLANGHQPQRDVDSAGPLPPDTPISNRPRMVTQEIPAPRDASHQVGSVGGSQNNRTSGVAAKPGSRDTGTYMDQKTNVVPTTDSTKGGAKVESTSTANSGYPAATYVPPPLPQPTRPVVATTTGSAVWKSRGEIALRWLSANRIAATIGALVLFSLVIFGSSALYKSRRKQVKAERTKVRGVQPKYVPGPESEDNSTDGYAEEYESVLGNYASASNQPEFGVAGSSASIGATVSPNGRRKEQTVLETVPTQSVPAFGRHRWVPESAIAQNHIMSNREQEREVFEL